MHRDFDTANQVSNPALVILSVYNHINCCLLTKPTLVAQTNAVIETVERVNDTTITTIVYLTVSKC